MKVTPIRTRIFREHDDLVTFITQACPRLVNGSILVITSKIVALSEGRTAPLGSARTKAALVKAESDFAVKTPYTWFSMKDGMFMAAAGVDESNGDGRYILLPRDSFAAARRLRTALKKHYRLRRLGVLVTDSRTTPLRAGVTGVALGYAGFRGVRDYRGMADIFGRRLRFSRTNVADSLATAAVVAMGEGAERQPLAVITDAPVEWRERVDHNEVKIAPHLDVYRPLFRWLGSKRQPRS